MTGAVAIPPGPFDVIVVDPPWAYGSDTGRTRTAEHHYRTTGHGGRELNRKSGDGVQELAALFPVADVAAPSAAVYLWTTNPKLPFAFSMLEIWGFTYKTTLTWVKTLHDWRTVHGAGMGWFFRGATEHILFGTRGSYGIPPHLRRPNVIQAPPGAHSEKPAVFYEQIEAVSPGQQRLDVFARRERPGWTCWGDEVAGADATLFDGLGAS